jgi:hypothetical protein
VKEPERVQVRHGNVPICLMQYGHGDIAEAEANARLIAIAPTMCDMLKTVLIALEDRYDGAPDSGTRWMGELIEQIETVLQKGGAA